MFARWTLSQLGRMTMRRRLLLCAIALLAGCYTYPAASTGGGSGYYSGRRCVRGCPCGNTCISCSKTCRVGTRKYRYRKHRRSYRRRRY